MNQALKPLRKNIRAIKKPAKRLPAEKDLAAPMNPAPKLHKTNIRAIKKREKTLLAAKAPAAPMSPEPKLRKTSTTKNRRVLNRQTKSKTSSRRTADS